MAYRNVLVLGVAQAASTTAIIMLALIGGLIGMNLAPSAQWATLPLGSMALGAVVFTVPAAWLMSKVGRRRGFIVSALVAACAALGAVYAIWVEDFFWFNLSVFFVGANAAFVQQYRFAAAESVSPQRVSKAVSWVLVGSIVAAYAGPELGILAKGWLPYGDYSGSLFVLALLFVFAAVLLSLLKDFAPPKRASQAPRRSLSTIVARPDYLVAVLAAMTAVGLMNFIMTATPISMHIDDGYSVNQAAWVIQTHAVAMFLPALFTGQLVGRWGPSRVMFLGVGAIAACVGLAATGQSLATYWVALALLGLGWNFLFIAGTSLLVKSYPFSERFRAQALNDFLVFGVGALANFLAGTALDQVGWKKLNLLGVPFLTVMLVALLVLRRQHQKGGKRAALSR